MIKNYIVGPKCPHQQLQESMFGLIQASWVDNRTFLIEPDGHGWFFSNEDFNQILQINHP